MKYVMMIAEDPTIYQDLSDTERKDAYESIFAHIAKWEQRGRYIAGGAELQGQETGRTMRRDGSGGVVVTDGPYAEIKEMIGGFMIIEADSIDDAVETASEWPGIQYGASVEVRPAVDHSQS